MTRKGGLGALLLAGAAAFGYYKFSKMNEQEKQDLKAKAKKLYEDNVPENIRSMFAGKGNQEATAQSNGTPGSYTQA